MASPPPCLEIQVCHEDTPPRLITDTQEKTSAAQNKIMSITTEDLAAAYTEVILLDNALLETLNDINRRWKGTQHPYYPYYSCVVRRARQQSCELLCDETKIVRLLGESDDDAEPSVFDRFALRAQQAIGALLVASLEFDVAGCGEGTLEDEAWKLLASHRAINATRKNHDEPLEDVQRKSEKLGKLGEEDETERSRTEAEWTQEEEAERTVTQTAKWEDSFFNSFKRRE
ncbi:hypothetical protein IWZ00DRAFT_484255 [Phyllosticta capitalensis]|uniref:uncharacterized protein n=1 Tax=Phyllosticta capitalensis TaxID=121624 RepID=UPI003130352F